MPEAAKRSGMTSDGVRRSLTNAGVPLVRINAKAWAVEETDLAAHLARRPNYTFGRPRKASSEEAEASS
jgi:hypothetical protein